MNRRSALPNALSLLPNALSLVACVALLAACSGVPKTSIYRGFDTLEVGSEMVLTVAGANDLIEVLGGHTRFDPSVGVDKAPPSGVRWDDWLMRFDQHLRLERQEAATWRLMTRTGAGTWAPWYYLPEKVATFVAAGYWNNGHEPIAVVAYGTDVVFLINKVWYRRRSAARQLASGMGNPIRRTQSDWADLDLAGVLGGDGEWRLLLDPQERALWVLPMKDGALQADRSGWRFAVEQPAGVLYRFATRVKFNDPEAAPLAADGGGS